MTPTLRPTTYTIFGITGDLAQKKIIPALYGLYVKDKLPTQFAIVGFSRKAFSQTEIRDFVATAVIQSDTRITRKSKALVKFLPHVSYVQGDYADIQTFTTLVSHLAEYEKLWKQSINKLFYLSVPPVLYENILTTMHRSGLGHAGAGKGAGWVRMLVEKPFGSNTASVQKLNRLVAKYFNEDQIYRVDHYMAKESLRNIQTVRESDVYMSGIWNAEHIAEVHIRLLEKNIPEHRGAFYDVVGALNDVGQNHILQMLALVAVSQQKKAGVSMVQVERTQLFDTLAISTNTAVRGQYVGFRGHDGVNTQSETETFFSLTVTPRVGPLTGVPVHITSGKGFATDTTHVSVWFKNSMTLTFSSPKSEGNSAYEKILLDCMFGDQSLFISGTEVEAQWKFVTRAKKVLLTKPLVTYTVGTSEIRV